MKREEIEKASNEKFGDNSFSYKGFIEGVEWRINGMTRIANISMILY